METFPRGAPIALYLQISVFGAVLISWFWSMISERFDPRTARRRIARIAGGGTVGGLVGGIAAERAAVMFSVPSLLFLLAALHVVCALAALSIGRGGEDVIHDTEAEEDGSSALAVLRRTPYLRHLALLVLFSTVGATLLDYVFKVRAQEEFTDATALLRFFAVFHTGVAALTFVLQSTLTRRVLESFGLARTASSLPLFLGVGGVGALIAPGLPVLGAVRGLESAIRSSVFRSSYELFYTPLAPTDKRASKTIIDVGFERLGDAAGGGMVQLLLVLGLAAKSRLLIAGAVMLAVAGLLVTRRLHAGYIDALERNLVRRSDRVHGPQRALDQTAFQESTQMDLSATLPDIGRLGSGIETIHAFRDDTASPGAGGGQAGARPPDRPPTVAIDPVAAAAAALRSREPLRVRRALRASGALPSELVAMTTPLLAWDAVSSDAQSALRAVCDGHVGQLVDALLHPDQEFSVRRRIPRVLARSTSARAVDGLLAGLSDRRFEVRYQCGAALARMVSRNPGLTVPRDVAVGAVLREAKVDRRVWESQRLLDDDVSPFLDEVLRKRSSRSLEHVFTLLSFIYAAEPLRMAYRGLHTTDDHLRGTALEYLESILPPAVRDGLWPFLDDGRVRRERGAPDAALDSLLKSHESIRINLDELRKRSGPE